MDDIRDLPCMLIRVKRLNYDTNYAYAPPQEDAVVNLADVRSVVETDARGTGPFVRVTFRDGSTMTCCGVPGDFLIGGEIR
jgi:hypothetical protein